MILKTKIQIILAFVFRLPLIALSALHLRSVSGYSKSKVPQLAVTESLFFLQIMITWSLVSATAPNLRQLLASFDTQFGMRRPPQNADENQDAYPLVKIGGRYKISNPVDMALSRRGYARHEGQGGGREQQPRTRSSLRSDVFQQSVRNGTADGTQDTSDAITEDEDSISRRGSREMIIRKGSR